MSKIDLNKIRIAVSPVTGTLYLMRHGKDETLALDKREIELGELFGAVVDLLRFDGGNAKSWEISSNKSKFKITIMVRE